MKPQREREYTTVDLVAATLAIWIIGLSIAVSIVMMMGYYL